MTTSILIKDSQASFQFKTSFSPCIVLQLTRFDLSVLGKEIAESIARAPNFFIGSPIVIDLEKIPEVEVDFVQLKEVLVQSGLIPIGIRGGDEVQITAARKIELPSMTLGKFSAAETKKTEITKPKAGERITPKLITHPIRSGVQVYAKETDLIVVGQVSPGAELMADGHIHVYGSLRGRAMAGVQGNTQARIFCRTLEAELVSIAGYYLTKEDMQVLPAHEGMIQIYLENEQVKIEAV